MKRIGKSVLGTLETHLIERKSEISVIDFKRGPSNKLDAATVVAIDAVIEAVKRTAASLSDNDQADGRTRDNLTRDGTPMRLFLVLTFGVASCLDRGIFDNIGEAEKAASEIRKDGGAPKIYECKLCSPIDSSSAVSTRARCANTGR
jgi:hypothetical protein